MAKLLVQEAASWRLDEIYRYTRDRWGTEQADRYIAGLFEAFDGIDTHRTSSRPVPAEFGIEGYFFRYERHFVYLAPTLEWRHRHRDHPARADAPDRPIPGRFRFVTGQTDGDLLASAKVQRVLGRHMLRLGQ